MSKHFSASSSLISKSIGFFQWVFGLMPIMRSMVNTSLRDFLVLFSDIKIPFHEIRSFYVTSKRQSLQRPSETFNLIVPSTWISVWDLVSSSDEVADCQLAPVTTVLVKCVKKAKHPIGSHGVLRERGPTTSVDMKGDRTIHIFK